MAMRRIGKDVRRCPRVKSTRPAVGQIGSPEGVAALARCKGIALRAAPTRKTDLFPSNCFILIRNCSRLGSMRRSL